MDRHLFVYGTLMDAEIMQRVSGQAYEGENAVLTHYQRKMVKGEVYPAIFSKENEQVEGKIYYNISCESINRLDRFEGEMYFRDIVNVSLLNDAIQQAETYVLKPEYYHVIDDKDWEYDLFMQSGKKIFEDGYFGFGELQS